jgi:hypothetical protein
MGAEWTLPSTASSRCRRALSASLSSTRRRTDQNSPAARPRRHNTGPLVALTPVGSAPNESPVLAGTGSACFLAKVSSSVDLTTMRKTR